MGLLVGLRLPASQALKATPALYRRPRSKTDIVSEKTLVKKFSGEKKFQAKKSARTAPISPPTTRITMGRKVMPYPTSRLLGSLT